ncbi:hypothetical protein DEO72_LG10g1150 [Vigna unguiculata]|uniref:Uncharacterized protein n=1 Tax=Vigna unguiculata TaxID=3917 RepID=A0A4D6NDD8_VIGUN|nr:hypothetical protein DEO72_LG10g1150 [Vigna unguiculata]
MTICSPTHLEFAFGVGDMPTVTTHVGLDTKLATKTQTVSTNLEKLRVEHR